MSVEHPFDNPTPKPEEGPTSEPLIAETAEVSSASTEQHQEIEQSLSEKRAELAAAPVDEMPRILAEIQGLEEKRNISFDSAHDEAQAENDRLDKEVAETERLGRIDADITVERAKLSGATPEQLSEIVTRITQLEAQKVAESNDETSPGVAGVEEAIADSAVETNEKTPLDKAAEMFRYRVDYGNSANENMRADTAVLLNSLSVEDQQATAKRIFDEMIEPINKPLGQHEKLFRALQTDTDLPSVFTQELQRLEEERAEKASLAFAAQ